MDRALKWLAAIGGSCLLAAGAVIAGASGSPAAPTGAASPGPEAQVADEKELRPLLDRLSELSDLIGKQAQSPEIWRHHLEQAQVMMKLAGLSTGGERNKWVQLAVDSCYSAVVQSPEKEQTAYNWLVVMPQQIRNAFPGCPVYSYAAMQEIQADHLKSLEKTDNPNKVQEHLRDRLMAFAREYPLATETPPAVMEAAQICESQGQPEEARRCYHYLIEQFPGQAAARKAGGALWRLGLGGETVTLDLPLLFAPDGPNTPHFDLGDLRGQVVVVYFWSSTSSQAAEDFQTLKQLTDRYQYRGLEMVYVNMDNDPAQARKFLSGRLTAGTHLFQADGLNGVVAENYGIQNLPQCFLIGKDGKVIRHTLPIAKLESELTAHVQRAR